MQELRVLVARREPVNYLLTVFVERPEVAVLEEERVRFLEALEEGSGGLREASRQILVVGFQEISERDLQLAYLQFFAVFLHYP